MLSTGAPAIRVARHWRAPLSLGLGVPLLLGSSPVAAAGAGGVVFAGVTTWLGMGAALLALLAPRRPGDLAGAAAIVVVGALILAVAARRRNRQRSHGRGEGMSTARSAARSIAASSIFDLAGRTTSPAAAHVDRAAVLEAARARFLRLQAAWDAGDVQTLGHLTTPDMLRELLPVLNERAGGPSRTDVITLHAELLGVEELGAAWLASVEFSGLIRESAEQGAVPFRELWMLSASKEGPPSWRLARQQALL